MRDLRAALAGTKCWDRQTQALFDEHGEALEDCALQNREELLGLCEFIEAHDIRSYLERQGKSTASLGDVWGHKFNMGEEGEEGEEYEELEPAEIVEDVEVEVVEEGEE